jgi:PAS domain S-box-containing protein
MVPALEFIDNRAASEILSDLAVEEDILDGAVYDATNGVFASYKNPKSDSFRFTPDYLKIKNYELREPYLYITYKIVRKNEYLGTLLLRSNLKGVNSVIRQKIAIAATLILFGMFLSIFIAIRLQAYISEPLTLLAGLTQKITSTGNYSSRADVKGKDETGILATGFNNMLDQIEMREKELSKNNNLMNSILQSIADGVVASDKNGNFILWNTASDKILGIGPVQISPEQWPNVYNTFKPDMVTSYKPEELPLTRAINGEEIDNAEMFIKSYSRPEGVFLNISSRPLRDQQSNIIGGVLVMHDITENKKMRDALNTAKQQLQDIFDNSSAIIYTKNRDGRYMFVNRQWEKTLLTSAEEVIGNTDFEMWPREFADQFIRNDRKVIEMGQSISFEETMTSIEGLRTYVSIKFPLRDASGYIYGTCGMATDITERKRIEEEDKQRVYRIMKLQETLRQLTDLDVKLPLPEKINHIEKIIAETLNVDRVSMWFYSDNKKTIRCENIYILSEDHYSPGQTLLKSRYPVYFNMLEIYSTIDAHDAQADPRTVEFTADYLKPNNITSMLDVPIKTGGKNIGILCLEHVGPQRFWTYEEQVFTSSVAGIVSIAIEHNEREKTELQLHNSNKELAEAKVVADQSNASKGIFLASMSHEIRTPLNAIIGFTQLLEDTELNTEQKEFVRSIDFAGRNLMVIINDILDLSKIEAGKLEFNEIPFSIKETCRSVVELVEHRAKEKKLKLLLMQDPAIPGLVIGDPARLSQILINLAGNAIKFTEKGEVKITSWLLEETDTEVACEFVVEDTGIGIPENKLEKIFERFTQETPETSVKFGGTGLGLTISRHLVELQQGRINVKSQPGKGSVFSFQLRYRISTGTESQPGTFNKLRILLAEDTPLNQVLVKKIFDKTGHDLEIAGNGIEAVNKIKNDNFDAVLMDIQMPEMDGLQATREIRRLSDRRKSSVPIIGLSALIPIGDSDKFFKAGMNAYLTKPFTKKDLFRTIDQLTMQENPEQSDIHKTIPLVPSGKLYNLDYLTESSDGDQAFISHTLKELCNGLKERARQVEEAFNDEAFENLSQIAHKIKNHTLPLKADKVTEVADIIERNSPEGKYYPEIKSDTMTLISLLRLLIRQLEEEEDVNDNQNHGEE